jgi:hypothetical protein
MPLKHLVRLLTLLALLFAPAGMMAMAAPQPAGAAAAAGHCADAAGMGHEAPGDEPAGQGMDCFIACSCVPSFGAELADRLPFVDTPASAPPQAMRSGLNPRADLPPPRIS